jgi:hypothetical protein
MKKVTKRDIEDLSQHDPIVRACLIPHFKNECSFEDALCSLVMHLVLEKNSLQKQLIQKIERTPVKSVKVNPDG